MTRSGSTLSCSAHSDSYSSGARRGTFSPPGSVPGCEQPLMTHCCITAQISSSRARTSSAGRQACSFSAISSLIDSPVTRHCSQQFGRR